MILEMLNLKKREEEVLESLKDEELSTMEAFFGDTAIIIAAQELNQLRDAAN